MSDACNICDGNAIDLQNMQNARIQGQHMRNVAQPQEERSGSIALSIDLKDSQCYANQDQINSTLTSSFIGQLLDQVIDA